MTRMRGWLCLVLLVMVGCVGLPAGLPAARTFASPVETAPSSGLRYKYYWPIWFGGYYEGPTVTPTAPNGLPVGTVEAAVTISARATRTPTATRTATRTNTATATRTATQMSTATATRTATQTSTATRTPTRMPSVTPSVTPTNTPTVRPSVTPTGTAHPGLNKLGLGGCPSSCEALGCSWCYSWNPQPGVGQGHERVPMIWGRNDVGATPIGNSIWLMGFNEPDLSGQANLSVDAAAVLWREVERLYPDRKLVAPAPSDVWIGWLPAFRSAYFARYGAWPRLDALAFHCYRPSATDCIGIGQQFVSWARAWGVREVWATEFAFLPAWTADAEGEARRFVAWLEGEPRVTRYAPFVSYIDFSAGPPWWWPWAGPGTNPSVLTETGELSAIGRWYAR